MRPTGPLPHWRLGGLLCLLAAAAVVLSQAGRVSAWFGYPTQNTPICTAQREQYEPVSVSDNSGGAIFTWYDYRNGSSWDIYAQRVDHSGVVQWNANGALICTASGNQYNPQPISDGTGGAIITWYDGRGASYDIYAQKVNSGGVGQWTDNGVAICAAANTQSRPQLVSDGSGGAIITWRDYRSGNDDVYAQRVDSTGAVQWSADGVAICTASNSQYDPQLVSDGSGGVIITWRDYRNGNDDVYAQRVNSAGVVQWTSNGAAICTAANTQYDPRLISEETGGAIITWYDKRSGNNDIYAQRVNSSGAVQWTADGVVISTGSADQVAPQITSDLGGGAIITWQDKRSGNYDIYAQRVNSSGAVQWTADAVPVCAASGDQLMPRLVSDGSGGAAIAWYDARTPANNTDVYAQRVNSSGVVQWIVDGAAVCTMPALQWNVQVVSDGSGGAIIGWVDYRNGNYDIYADRVDSGGNLPDTARPEATLTSTATSPTKTSPIPMTATFGEAVTGFTLGDIVVGNGAASNFVVVSPTVYTFDVSPSGQGLVTVNVAADVAQDAAGNGNTAATQYAIVYDTMAPTVTLSSTASSPTKTSPIPMMATFSENVTGFTLSDISVGNGAASSLVAVSGMVYTFDVTPSGQGAVTVDVAADVVQDAAGNGNTAATQYAIVYDTVAPAVTLSSTASSPTKTSPVPMTATFSENATGFTLGDIGVGNGTAGNFVAVNATIYTFDVTLSGQGLVTVNVAGDMAQDAAGNGNTAATQFGITYDSVAPTLTLTSTATSPTKTSPIPVTATFSENVTGLTLGDIVVGNGAASNLVTVSPTVYTFDVSPSGQGAVTVDVAADVAQDAAGNGNTAATQYAIVYDTVAPTVILTSTATSPTKTSPVPMTATFSENVTGFTLGDIVVGNGAASNFAVVSPTVYTFDVTPLGQGAVTVDVAVDVAEDAAGNGNTAAAQFGIVYDSVAPTVTLTSTATSPTKTSPIPMTATFSENVIGFALGGISVGNGTASNLVAVSGMVYTFDVTPSGQGLVTVDVAGDSCTDPAGNGNTTAAQFGIVYDSVAPTVTLTSTATSPTKTSPIPMTATFSENVTGFTIDDVVVGNGTAGSFVVVSGTIYTFDVTPLGQGLVTVNVAGDVAQDTAGNGNTAATQFSLTYDSVAPTVTLTSTATSPTKTSAIPMTATFSESVTGFTLSDISVGNGTASNFVVVSSSVYTFDVTPSGQGAVTVNVAAGVAFDAALNGNAAAAQFSITYDTVAPTTTLTSTASSPTKASPIPMTATLSENVTGFTVDDVVVGNGTAGNFVAVSGSVYTFDVTPAGQGAVTVDMAAGVAFDAALNGNAAATRYSITFTPPPTITSFTVTSGAGGDTVVITGANFTGATGVRFGDKDAMSFSVDSATQITAAVDHGAGGKISITTLGGTATSDEDYVPPAAPSKSGKGWLTGGIVIAAVVLSGAIAWWLILSRRKKERTSA